MYVPLPSAIINDYLIDEFLLNIVFHKKWITGNKRILKVKLKFDEGTALRAGDPLLKEQHTACCLSAVLHLLINQMWLSYTDTFRYVATVVD